MNFKPLMAALCALAAELHGMAAGIDDATYAGFFDRAAALLPGVTAAERDLTRNFPARHGNYFGDVVHRELWRPGAWEIAGGRRLDEAGALVVAAAADTVELTWRVDTPQRHPGLKIILAFDVESAVPLRMSFCAGRDGRFNRVGGEVAIEPASERSFKLNVPAPGPRDAALSFDGIKLIFAGQDLAGRRIVVRHPRLQTEFFEGFFRYEFDLPAGKIWSAAAEVSDSNTLYVNGARVDDASIVMPRPTTRGPSFYLSRRVPLERYLRPGRNVLALHATRTSHAPAAWLRGSVIMASGRRIMLDTGTNWVWNNEAPENWHAPEYDVSAWREIHPHSDMPPELGLAYEYRGAEAVASLMSGFGLSFRPMGNLPCYDGLIKLRNPTDKKLYFNEAENFQLEIFIPPGFKDQNPELAWAIRRYDGPGAEQSGMFTEVARGNIKDFQSMDDSLAGEINSARLARGIYVFTSRLMVGDKIIEEREPEPLVVTGKVPMPHSAGDAWEQGMDLALETTVDFTNPDDPHPWLETDHKGPIPGEVAWGPAFYHTVEPALIVEHNGLKYRMTRPINRAQFSYKVDFAHPGDWYLMVLEYPDDAERWIGVSCNADRTQDHLRRRPLEERYNACSKCGPAIWTGGKYPNTGKMLEMKWLYRPDPGSHAINVMSLMKDTAAAAARLRVYHIAGRLPELNAGDLPAMQQRRFGMVTERTHPWENGIYNLFGAFDNRVETMHVASLQSARGGGQYSSNAIVEACEYLRLLEDAASHYAEYMRFTGQNIHAMGCFQYDDGNTAPQYLTGDPRIHNSPENMLARVLAANDLMFYASVEYVCTSRFAAGGDNPEWFFADRRGERPMSRWAGKPLNLNFLHPAVEAEMLELARQLAQGFQHQSNFLGINWTAMFSGFFIPSYRKHTYPYNAAEDPLGYGYDDLTISLFEKETGIRIPAAGDNREPGTVNREPLIHEQRYQFLTSPEIKPAWLAWRSQKMAEFFAKVNRVINEVRPGLETVAGCYLVTENIREWAGKKISFTDYLDAWGRNPAAFEAHDGTWLMPWLPIAARYAPAARQDDYAMGWQANKHPDFYRAFAGLHRRAIMLYAGWIEVERCAANFPARAGWPRPYQQTMMAQQREEMALEPYTQAMIGMDPQMVMNGFTDVTPYIGVEEAQRKFARVLRRLPWGQFAPVLDTGLDSNLAIRALRVNDDLLFYVANPGYWPVKGSIKLAHAGKVINMVSGELAAMHDGSINVELEPFGIAAFRAAPSAISNGAGTPSSRSAITIIASYTVPVPEQDLAHMRGLIERAKTAVGNQGMAEFLGAADYGVLTNTIATAEKALAEQRYAAAWSALTDAPFWTAAFQKAPEIVHVEITKPRTLPAAHIPAGQTPRVDGVLDDHVWQNVAATAADAFVTRDKEYSSLQTTVRAAWSGARLFLAIDCPDPDPEKIRGTTDKDNVTRTIWGSGDDLIAIFIKPAGGVADEINYFQMVVTANGAKFDQHNRIRHGVHVRDYEYAPHWRAAAARTPAGWALEMEFDPLENFGVPPRQGAAWKLNVHRQFRLNQFPVSSWTFNPGDWHSLKHMGTMTME